MRILYDILTYLLSPVYGLYWLFRGLTNRDYWDRLGQRFGFGYPRVAGGTIWLHAVSVGEVQASAPLVKALGRRFPDCPILITTVTPTGAARARRLFGDQVAHSYLPFEAPFCVRRFFDAVSPRIALIMETEIWPNLYYACGVRRIPLILVSARISPRSLESYRKLLPLFRETLSYGIVIAAQSWPDANRFRELGAAPERTSVTGNIKFDIELDAGIEAEGIRLRQRDFPGRPVWIAASTHDKEEDLVLAAHRLIQRERPDALLVLVPRHPERFPLVAAFLQKNGFRYVKRTDRTACDSATEVLLVDTMGEVPLFYAASDVAFVGGTLVPVGGHNLLEPAALGKPVITGPYLFNTQQIADMFLEVGASSLVRDDRELAHAVLEYFANPDQALRAGSEGLSLLQRNRGALARLLDLMQPAMDGVGIYPVSPD